MRAGTILAFAAVAGLSVAACSRNKADTENTKSAGAEQSNVDRGPNTGSYPGRASGGGLDVHTDKSISSERDKEMGKGTDQGSTAGDNSKNAKDAYKDQAESRVDSLKDKLDDYDSKAGDLSGNAKTSVKMSVDKAKKELDAVKKKLKQFDKGKTDDPAMRTSIDSDLHRVEGLVNQIGGQFKAAAGTNPQPVNR
jgi:hypothetical protein